MKNVSTAVMLGLIGGVVASVSIHPAWLLAQLTDDPPNLGLIGWVAFVPVFYAIGRAGRPWGAMLAGAMFGMTWFLLTCMFITSVHWVGWLAAGICWFFYAALVAWGLWHLRRLAPRWIALTWPAVWVFGDFLHASIGVKFPWLFAAYSQLDADPWLAQTADLLGVWLPSFLVLAANVVLAQLLLARRNQPADQSTASEATDEGLANTVTVGAAVGAKRRPWRMVWAENRVPVGGVVSALVVAHGYGAARLATLETSPGPVVALMQPNIPLGLQRQTTSADADMRRLTEIADGVAHTQGLGTHEIPSDTIRVAVPDYEFAGHAIYIQRTTDRPVDLLVMPETAFQNSYQEYRWAAETPMAQRMPFYASLVKLCEPFVASVQAQDWHVLWSTFEFEPGVTFSLDRIGQWWEDEDARLQNCSVLVAPDGRVKQVYAKIELVPVGEYVPLRDLTTLMRDLTVLISGLERPPDYRPGDTPAVFTLRRPPVPLVAQTQSTSTRPDASGIDPAVLDSPNAPEASNGDGGVAATAVAGFREYTFGTAICFESNFPQLFRDMAKQGAKSVIVQSNDGWFIGSEELMQIWLGARYRAIETRMGVARAVNSGISGVVGPDGAMSQIFTATVDGQPRNFGFGGALVTELPQGPGTSLYVWVGDVLPILCGLVMTPLVFIGAWRYRRQRQAAVRRRAAAPISPSAAAPSKEPTTDA